MTSALEDLFAFQLSYPDRKLSPNARGKWVLKEYPCILAGAPEGGIVFDPFVGSGTTVATALQLGRHGVGLDLSMKYLRENAKDRIDSVRLPLLECAL